MTERHILTCDGTANQTMYDFATTLRLERARTQLSQIDVAAMLGISPTTLSTYEHGRRIPSLKVMVKLADIYGTTLDYLAGRSPQRIAVGGDPHVNSTSED